MAEIFPHSEKFYARPGKFPLLALAVGTLSISVLVVVFWIFGKPQRQLTVLLVIALFVLVTFTFVRLSSSFPIGHIQPLHLLGITLVLHFGLRALLIAIDSPFVVLEPRVRLMAKPIEYFLNIALSLAIVGYASAWLGYSGPVASRLATLLPKLSLSWVSPNAIWRLVAIWVLGWISSLVIIFLGGGVYVNAQIVTANLSSIALFAPFASLRNIGLLGAWLLYFRSQNRAIGLRLICWIGLMVELGFALTAGYKAAFFTIALLLTIAKLYSPKPFAAWKPALLSLVMFPLILTYVDTFRAVIIARGLYLAPEELLAVVTMSIDQLFAGDSNVTYQHVSSGYANRLVLDTFLVVLLYTPKYVPYLHGSSLIMPLIHSFVPSIIWPQRPTFTNGFNDLFGQTDGVSGTAITFIGDLYLNFGPLGILVGMYILGIFLRLVYQALGSNAQARTGNVVLLGILCASWLDFAGMSILGFVYYPLFRVLPIGLLAVIFVDWPIGNQQRIQVTTSTTPSRISAQKYPHDLVVRDDNL